MSKFQIKKLPPIKLTDLLKKRKTNLKNYLASSGITTYVTLQQKCNSLGVSAPSEAEFHDAVDVVVSSPQEGVVVLDPPTLLKDSGEKIQVDEIKPIVVEEPVVSITEQVKQEEVVETIAYETPVIQQKNPKRKKEKENPEGA